MSFLSSLSLPLLALFPLMIHTIACSVCLCECARVRERERERRGTCKCRSFTARLSLTFTLALTSSQMMQALSVAHSLSLSRHCLLLFPCLTACKRCWLLLPSVVSMRASLPRLAGLFHGTFLLPLLCPCMTLESSHLIRDTPGSSRRHRQARVLLFQALISRLLFLLASCVPLHIPHRLSLR